MNELLMNVLIQDFIFPPFCHFVFFHLCYFAFPHINSLLCNKVYQWENLLEINVCNWKKAERPSTNSQVPAHYTYIIFSKTNNLSLFYSLTLVVYVTNLSKFFPPAQWLTIISFKVFKQADLGTALISSEPLASLPFHPGNCS